MRLFDSIFSVRHTVIAGQPVWVILREIAGKQFYFTYGYDSEDKTELPLKNLRKAEAERQAGITKNPATRDVETDLAFNYKEVSRVQWARKRTTGKNYYLGTDM